MERTSAAEPSPTFLLFHIEIEMYRIYLWCSTKVHEIEREREGDGGGGQQRSGVWLDSRSGFDRKFHQQHLVPMVSWTEGLKNRSVAVC